MGWTRHTGTAVSLALLASVVANYAVHRHCERRIQQQTAIHSGEQAALPGALFFDDPAMSEPGDMQVSIIPRYLDDEGPSRPLSPVVAALQTSESDDVPANSQSAPHPVPVPNDAVPIADEPADSEASVGSRAVRKVIEDELSGSSREEQEIWFEELKSLPAGVVRDLLQVRKQLRALPRALHKMDAAESVPAPRVATLPAEPASQTRRVTLPDWAPTIVALEQACSISRHNLANATTPGFKRLRVMLVDSYGTQWHDDDGPAADPESPHSARRNPIRAEGCRVTEPLLDLKQGTLHQTDRQLDLAIDGDGFFVALLNDKPVYTRCGAMVLDAERRLCLAVADGAAVVEPGITIPADAREIQVSANGTVMALVKLGAEPIAVGQLALARFPSPSRLRPIGGTLLSPTDGSGAAEIGVADEGGRGVVQQGCLEQSNVALEEVLVEIEQWQSLLKSFPLNSRPVTASGQEQRSR